MSGSEEDKEWALKVAEMDRLCQLHLDVPYSVCAPQGHYIFVKLAPEPDKIPLKSASGIYMPKADQKNEVYCALVLAMGRYAFKDGVATKWEEGPLCELGDTIAFYTPEFIRTSVNGYTVGTLRDTNVMYRTTHPHLFGTYSIGRSSRPREANKVIYKRKDLEELGLSCVDPLTKFRDDFEGDAK